jgi:hypothetical protein
MNAMLLRKSRHLPPPVLPQPPFQIPRNTDIPHARSASQNVNVIHRESLILTLDIRYVSPTATRPTPPAFVFRCHPDRSGSTFSPAQWRDPGLIPTLRSSLRLTNALLPLWKGHRPPLSRASGKRAFVSSSSLYTAPSFSYTHPQALSGDRSQTPAGGRSRWNLQSLPSPN